MNTEFQRAVSLHRAGQFQEAERDYLSVLQQQPNHPEANHNLGVLMVQMKQPAAALPHFLAALEADGANGQYWISYIDALHQAGQIDDARQILALARQQGLQGEEVDELQRRLNGGTTGAGGGARPTNQQIDEVVALFGAGRLEEAAGIAQQLTERYPQHEFGWKALGAIYKQQGKSDAALAPMQKAAALSPNDVEAHYNLGVTLQEMGRFDEAEAAYRQALQIDPNYADAHSNLGVVLQTSGRLSEAEEHYRRAVQINPGYAAAHYNLGNVLRESGSLDEAADSYRRALRLKADDAQIHYRLAEVLKQQGRLDESAASYRLALEISPDNAYVHYNLGNVCKDMGQLAQAEHCYRQAVRIAPDFAQAHYNLGVILQDAGRLDEAATSYRSALQIDPGYSDAHYNLGNVSKDLGDMTDAEASYRKAIEIDPGYADAFNNLGNVLKQQEKLDEAAVCYRRAIAIRPDYLEAHTNLGAILQKIGKPDQALSCFERALQIDPDCADAHNGLAITLHSLNRLGEAVAHFRRTLEIRPDFAVAHSNLIFTLELMADVDTATLMEERCRWSVAHAAHLYRRNDHKNNPDSQRRLRIGYVSADFRAHSAAYAFGAMLTSFDRDNFDVIAYSNSTVCDELTRMFQSSVTAWRDIARLSDDAAVDLIGSDQIDILVDLSGHSAGNRLLVFARKPAPIQVSAFGYASGTGIGAMDVLFSDPVFIPPDERHFYTEQIRYLPSAIGYFMPAPPPAVNALPALSNGFITFGSYNRLVKNSEGAYLAWAKILQAVPDSRMIFKTPALDDVTTGTRIKDRFAGMGVDPARIMLLGNTSRDAHMAAFNLIDIALDPFPHGGGVSALEGLVMGVPVLTLCWPTLAGRVSTSIATNLGLTDWIAYSPEQYVELAIEKASDLQSLAGLRQNLRGVFLSSVLGDQAAYVGAVEREYRQLWQEWCRRHPFGRERYRGHTSGQQSDTC